MRDAKQNENVYLEMQQSYQPNEGSRRDKSFHIQDLNYINESTDNNWYKYTTTNLKDLMSAMKEI